MSTGRHVCKLVGYAPALPTPFDENDAINAAAFERFCELQISNGATALVVGGTTGEAPNLSGEEHHELLRIATGVSRGRVPIISGAGSNSTRHAIELTKDAEASGADAILSVVPKQTQMQILLTPGLSRENKAAVSCTIGWKSRCALVIGPDAR